MRVAFLVVKRMTGQKGGFMDDLISRQALCEYALNQKDKSITPNDIMRFPPAQPEHTHSWCINNWCNNCKEIVRCKECRFHKSDGCFFSTAETIEDGFCSWAERRTDDKTDKGSSC